LFVWFFYFSSIFSVDGKVFGGGGVVTEHKMRVLILYTTYA